MKKCTQCGREFGDDSRFCSNCGSGELEQANGGQDAGAQAPSYYQRPMDEPQPGQASGGEPSYYQRPMDEPPPGQAPGGEPSYYQRPMDQPPPGYASGGGPPYYQQPAGQPPYRQGPPDRSAEPATLKDYLIFFLLMLIPIFNLIYMIIVAVGGPNYKKSMTNYARASLIWGAIGIVVALILVAVLGTFLMEFPYNYSYGYRY